jgi:hypothetical protein
LKKKVILKKIEKKRKKKGKVRKKKWKRIIHSEMCVGEQ